jgi:hypothetical protein
MNSFYFSISQVLYYFQAHFLMSSFFKRYFFMKFILLNTLYLVYNLNHFLFKESILLFLRDEKCLDRFRFQKFNQKIKKLKFVDLMTFFFQNIILFGFFWKS